MVGTSLPIPLIPGTSLPVSLIPGRSGSQETEVELMLGVRVLPAGFPPGLPLERIAGAGLKQRELVIIIWGLGMPIATNGPTVSAGIAPWPAVERKTSRVLRHPGCSLPSHPCWEKAGPVSGAGQGAGLGEGGRAHSSAHRTLQARCLGQSPSGSPVRPCSFGHWVVPTWPMSPSLDSGPFESCLHHRVT